MAVKELEKILRDARLRWSDIGRIAIAHRLGFVVLVSSMTNWVLVKYHQNTHVQHRHAHTNTHRSPHTHEHAHTHAHTHTTGTHT